MFSGLQNIIEKQKKKQRPTLPRTLHGNFNNLALSESNYTLNQLTIVNHIALVGFCQRGERIAMG